MICVALHQHSSFSATAETCVQNCIRHIYPLTCSHVHLCTSGIKTSVPRCILKSDQPMSIAALWKVTFIEDRWCSLWQWVRKKSVCRLFFSFVCDREGVTGVCGTGCISLCECVSASTYECVSEFSDLSVERLHVCLLWALWLKEHGATYLAVMCCREMPLMSATRCSTKGKAGTHVLKTQLLKIHKPLWSH